MTKKQAHYNTFAEPKLIASIKAEIEDTQRMLSSADENKSSVGYLEHSSKRFDPEEVQKALRQKKKHLAEVTPKKLTGAEANKAFEKAKKLKAWIISNIPRETYAMYPREKDPVRKAQDFEKVVAQHVWWNKHGTRALNAYNHLMQRLDPGRSREGFDRYTKERA